MKYLISDIHGDYGVWRKARDFLKEDDTLFILGDVVDRGPDGIKILLEVVVDKQVKMLIGNHEEMMIQASGYDDMDILRMWYANGGETTHTQMIQMLDHFTQSILIDWLKRLPTCVLLAEEKIILSHAGFHIPHIYMTQKEVMEYVKDIDRDDVLWDRSHTMWGQDSEMLLIHGHTPISYISKTLDPTTPVEYIKGKICIDTGVPSNKQCVMYCVDTKSVVRP